MALTVGARLGSYEVLAPLGAGGMGEVYRARDAKLGREVALKVLPESLSHDRERLAWFEREARMAASLNHPNIVVLHSIEEDAGIRFITMELVEGQGLDRYIEARGLPQARIVEIAISLAEALAAAHERGIVHRDLKPANIMVTRDGRVKVMDFGLAKVAQPSPGTPDPQAPTVAAPLSAPGQIVGTAPYMAPEQVRGEPVDARTDLFAFGIILYELAAGRRPFAGATFADVSSAILRDAPTPIATLRHDLAPHLVSLVERCLEKDPARRFQSATEIRDPLMRLQRSSSGDRPANEDDAPSIAVLPFVNMSRDEENEYFSDGLSEELLNVLAKIPELKVTGRTSSFAFKGKQEDLRTIGQRLGVRTLLEGSVRKAGNRVRITAQLIKVTDGFHLWTETYDRVLDDIFAVQDDIARSVSQALHVTLLGKSVASPKVNAETYSLLLQANHFSRQNAGPGLARAVALYQQVLEKSPESAPAWAGLAWSQLIRAAYGHAPVKESILGAREAAERAVALDPQLSDAHKAMGTLLLSFDHRFKDGLVSLRRAMELAPGAAGPMTMMAFYAGCFGDLDEALRLARRAQEIDPLNPEAHQNRGRIESWAGNLEAACDAMERVLELTPEASAAHSARGLIYLRRGMEEEALAEIQREPSAGYRSHALARAYHILGRKQESDEAMAELLGEDEGWAIQFASAYAVRGEADEAFRWLERAYELHDSGIVMMRVLWGFEGLHADPRWSRLLDKIGFGNL